MAMTEHERDVLLEALEQMAEVPKLPPAIGRVYAWARPARRDIARDLWYRVQSGEIR